jgi:hypothetical protein
MTFQTSRLCFFGLIGFIQALIDLKKFNSGFVSQFISYTTGYLLLCWVQNHGPFSAPLPSQSKGSASPDLRPGRAVVLRMEPFGLSPSGFHP